MSMGKKNVKLINREKIRDKSVVGIDKKALLISLEQGRKQPRVAFYSPYSSVILNYLKNTRPRFSISEEVASIIEAELSRRYPVVAAYVKRKLPKKVTKR